MVVGRSTSRLVAGGSPVGGSPVVDNPAGIEDSRLLPEGIGVVGSIPERGSLEEGVACMGLEKDWVEGRDRRPGGRVVGRKVVRGPVF